MEGGGETGGVATRGASKVRPAKRKKCTTRRRGALGPVKKTAGRRKQFRQQELERALYRWHRRSRAVGAGALELARRARALARRLGAEESTVRTIDRDWAEAWRTRFGVAPSPPPPAARDALERALSDGAYTDDQVYSAIGLELDWTSLPDRNLPGRPDSDRVWILTAANRSGRHRTRLLVTGKRWRPPCLRHVDMLSQPVVYAGGGVGRVTPDLFVWWFHREFVPAALALNSGGALLVVEEAAGLGPLPSHCATRDGKVRMVTLPPGPGSPLDQRAARSELRCRYAMLLLHGMAVDGQDTPAGYLARFTLKDAFSLLHRAWLDVRPETLAKSWEGGGGEEERSLLVEVQWLAHDLGLEVTDEDVSRWAAAPSEEIFSRREVKLEPLDEPSPLEPPSAAEAAACLSKALAWMESEPIEPSFLLASKMGLGAGHPGTGLPFFCHNGDPLSQPPPAHMGIPPYQLDPKGGEYRVTYSISQPLHIIPSLHSNYLILANPTI
ncbi:hypothetical protein AAG570_006943 [Ranatra chinensis]|uniref:HTH CENPB-type domain-containing protein n=1 Tax=Ranatra chinensis TaxID=642074 RepID=A0ABD0YVK1_9HEMI